MQNNDAKLESIRDWLIENAEALKLNGFAHVLDQVRGEFEQIKESDPTNPLIASVEYQFASLANANSDALKEPVVAQPSKSYDGFQIGEVSGVVSNVESVEMEDRYGSRCSAVGMDVATNDNIGASRRVGFVSIPPMPASNLKSTNMAIATESGSAIFLVESGSKDRVVGYGDQMLKSLGAPAIKNASVFALDPRRVDQYHHAAKFILQHVFGYDNETAERKLADFVSRARRSSNAYMQVFNELLSKLLYRYL